MKISRSVWIGLLLCLLAFVAMRPAAGPIVKSPEEACPPERVPALAAATAAAGPVWTPTLLVRPVEPAAPGWDDKVLQPGGWLSDPTVYTDPAWKKPRPGGVPANPYTEAEMQPRTVQWRGLPVKLEPLLPGLHFRPRYMTGLTGNTENREHLVFLGSQVDTSQARRRLYVDLGARTFESSIEWMMNNYPVKFDEMHGFEAVTRLWSLPDVATIAARINAVRDGRGLDRLEGAALQQEANRRFDVVHFHNAWINKCDRQWAGYVPHIDVARFMLEDLRVSRADFVVLKMDIEGMEWELLPHLEAAGVLDLVSEICVEVHYHHEQMYRHHWTPDHFSKTVEEATAEVERLRAKGYIVHYWP